MKYEIIKLSESHASYRNEIADKEWIGEIPGLVYGWQFEYKNSKGEYEYGSVSYQHIMSEEYANLFEPDWIHDTPRYNGWEPTGRVVFRGYAVELWDSEERDWYVEDYDISEELSYIVGR